MAACTHRVGRVKVHLVSDGVFWTDGGTNFGVVPKTLWEKVIQPDELNRIPMQLRCLLIESDAGLILVDTGYGDKLAPRRQEALNLHGMFRLGGELATLGYKPEDVAIVLNTHLHGDHAGGNTKLAEDGSIAPAFPNATYMAQRLELADATYPNERTRNAYFPENFLPLGNLCRGNQDTVLHVLNGDTHITDTVRTLTTPGHTRAHQAVIVESAGESAIFLADAVPWAITFEKLAWVAAFDVEPLVSMETKRSLRDWAWRKEALLFFQHDPLMRKRFSRGEGGIERR
ncbi:MAG: MBL fold metallo-hydrolase [Anaerolineae bacterium]|nr:MBL fold metallo-hydrolase [Anaerolineae bacterium]